MKQKGKCTNSLSLERPCSEAKPNNNSRVFDPGESDLPLFSLQVPVLGAPKMLFVSMTHSVPATLDTPPNLGRNSSHSPWRYVKVKG